MMLKKKNRESIPGKSIVTKSLLKFLITCIFVFTLCLTSTCLSQELEPLIKGVDYYKKGEYDKALPEFLQAYDSFPDDADISMYVGLTYLHLKDNEKAIEYFEMAVALNPYNLDAHFQLGAALLQTGKQKEAITHLEEVFTFEPEREDLGYLLGNACYNLGQYENALHFFETGKTIDETYKTLTLYYSALAKQQVGLTKEARLKFEEIITYDPTSPVTPLSRRFVEILEIEERIKKRFHIEFTTKAGYDDNVLLVPTENVFRLKDKDEDSFFETAFLKTEYIPFRGKRWEVLTSYTFNETLYNSQRKFDVQSHSVSLEGLRRGRLAQTSYELRPSFTFDYFLVDYHYFLKQNSFRFPFILGESPRNMSILRYDFRTKDFKPSRPAVAADDRDATNHEIGFTHFLHTKDWKHYIKIGYTREWEVAEGDNWDYWANRILLGFQVTAPLKVKLYSNLLWQKDNYDHTNTFFNERREDIDRIYSATISRKMSEHITLFTNYTRRRNTSNIKLYDIEKNIFSFGVSFKY